MKIKIGDRVRMSEELKSQLRAKGSQSHVVEFGHCIGIVEGEVDWGGGCPSGPEVEVRWEPAGLRYAYHPSLLLKVV